MDSFRAKDIFVGITVLLLFVSAFISKKIESASNITFICAMILMCIFIWNTVKDGDSITRLTGRLGILLLIFTIFLKLNINLGRIPKITSILLFMSLVLMYTKMAFSSVTICTLWLLLTPLFLGALTSEYLYNSYEEINTNSAYVLLTIIIFYILTWKFMINRAELKVFENSIKTIFIFTLIILMMFNFLVDFVPSHINIQSILEEDATAFSSYYTIKEMLNIAINFLTYPLMINCSIFYLVLKRKEQKIV